MLQEDVAYRSLCEDTYIHVYSYYPTLMSKV